jgi:hypothetical protein
MGSPSGPRSGRHGYANGVPFVKNWSLNWSRATETRYHSASFNAPERFMGVEDWNGTIEGYGGLPSLFPGENVALKLFAGPDNGIFGNTGVVYEGTAIIDTLTLNWTWQPNASLGYSLGFSADGCLAQVENEYYDDTGECEASVCNIYAEAAAICDIETGTGTGTGTSGPPLFSVINNLESAVLTVTSANQAVVNSSTECCTEREPGTIEWTLALVDQEQYPLFQFNEYYAFKLFTEAGASWDLYYGLLDNIGDIRADRETGAIMTKTNNFLGSARICCAEDDGPTLGLVLDPAGNTKWPVAAV